MEQIKLNSKFADQQGEIMIVEVGGYVDQSNSHRLQKMFDNILDSNVYKVIVDFTGLFYMSSAGWGIFIGEVKRFRDHGGDIKLAAMNADIYDVYQMLEFYHILEDYNTVEEAAESYHDDSPILDLVKDTRPEEEGDNHKPEQSITTVGEIFVPGYKRKQESNLDKEEQGGRDQSSDDRSQTTERRDQGPEGKAQVTEEEEITFSTGEQMDLEYQAPPAIDFTPHRIERTVKLSELPLTEKIKRVIAENPLLGIYGIRRVLRHEHFGHVKIGPIKLYRTLKMLDLHTKAKRYRYYRSC